MGNFSEKENDFLRFGDSLTLLSMDNKLNSSERRRLQRLSRYWDFYKGYHWQEIEAYDGQPQTTVNRCRIYIDKLASFELRKGFTVKSSDNTIDTVPVSPEKKTIAQYLEQVWQDNQKDVLCLGIGFMKNITGDAWIQVVHEFVEDDIFTLFPDGKIRIIVHNSSLIFPEYDPYDVSKLDKISIRFPIISPDGSARDEYRVTWTKDTIKTIYDKFSGREEEEIPNPYGFIPFVQIKNVEIPGWECGISDLEDLIPLNVEYNIKKSDVSEIIDYHAAPITIITGAQLKQLEKGANKIWSLPKDATAENLSLGDNLVAATEYVKDLETSMNLSVHIPEVALGVSGAGISNTSSVALQFTFMPLIERVEVKRLTTKVGIEEISRMILKISIDKGMILIPDSFTNRQVYELSIEFPDMLPKDELIELQKMQSEIQMGIASRRQILERLNRTNIEEIIAEVDKDAKENPDFYAIKTNLNSGITNGQSGAEEVRKTLTGENKK